MACISVITPSFNSDKWLPLCIASVADQPGVEVEHIIQDAGSTDDTPHVLAKAPHVKAFVEKDQGMYDAVNRGFAKATGDIICYLNCDEQYLANSLAQVAEYFHRHPEVDAAFGHALLVRPDGSLIAHRKAYPLRRVYILTDHLYALSCAMFLRRRVIEDGMLFSADLRDVGDAVFVAQLLEHRYRIGIMPFFTSAFTMTGTNMSEGANARRELERLRGMAPAWARLFSPFLTVSRRVEKLLHGAYHLATPFTYQLHMGAGMRKLFVEAKPSFRWRSR